ncbi:MAG: elongation factor 1-beta [Candidatus Ranarchaeia archaeon]
MGKVYCQFAVMPESVDLDLEELKNRILSKLPSDSEVKQTKVEPFAFGLNKLILSIVVEDAEGKSDSIEKIIREESGVKDVIVEGMTLI